ncbi:hypothetical protein ABH931_002261, partial [Streptacidiphilus sp. MAP12-33]|uniref:hypothetical protein n=1 Tax=Streptacidiphilus sp. MAP12-33 TaxID=3156266 RepID=UPI0035138B51
MTRPPTRARRALLALTALLTAVLAALAPTVAAALPAPASLPAAAPEAQQQTFGIQPASASGPDQRAALTYAATPGAQLKDHVAVYNYGDDPLTLSLYAADAFNTSTGGYDVLPASRTSTDVGAWIHLAVGTITLPPRTRQIVPFTLAVPANASPGDHSGGVVLALRRHTTDAKGNDITVDQRVGTRVHLRVPGALRPKLVVESVAVSYRGTLNPFGTGTTTVSYTVRNAGNIRLAGRQAVRVHNAVGGLTTASGPGALTELLPGNTETYTVQVRGVFPTLWSTASITVDPMAVPGDADPALPSAISDHVYATISWTLVAVVIVLLAIAVSLFLRFRRRRRYGPTGTPGPFGGPPAGPSSPPTGSPAPVPVPAPVPSLPAPASGGSVGEAAGPVAVPVPVPSGPPASAPTPEASGSAAASLSAPASGGSAGEAAGPVAVPVPVPSGAPASAPTPGASGSAAAPLSAPASGGSAGEAAGPVAVPVPVPSGAPASA